MIIESLDSASTRAGGAPARLLSFLVLLITACFFTVTQADADLWGHLAFGRDIVRSGWVHATDPYSFTSDRPWVNHEWLAEAGMWMSYGLGGAMGLIVLKLLAITVAGALLLESWRRHALTPVARDGLLFATGLGAWPSLLTIRPQIFSLVLFAALLCVLERIGRRRLAWLLILPPMFAVWVNLHGGWLVGAGVLAVFVVSALFDSTFTNRDRRLLIAASLASAAATLCNPYGPRMLAFLSETVRPNRADILEWQPMTRVPVIALSLWLVPTLVALAAVWRSRRAIPVSSLLIALVLGVGTLCVVRLVSFYALAVGFLLAPYCRSHPRVAAAPPLTAGARCSAVAVCLSTIAISVALFGRQVAMDAAWLPEPEAAEFVLTAKLQGNMLTWFDYGEYAIWHFWPSIRVSMDGRRETVYTERMRALHFQIYRDAPGAVEEVAGLKPDYVWLPTVLPIARRLEAAGWQPIFRGSRSTLLCRRNVTAMGDALHQPATRRIFPGP